MTRPAMFLAGGPAFSGTTLLALLLDQGELVCLDEPDFHNPAQSHRGVPVLQARFPDRVFPPPSAHRLDWEETFRFIGACSAAIAPARLGVKTCDRPFIELAQRYRRAGYPVIAIVRDVRDALVRDLPPWVTEESLNGWYRHIWSTIDTFALWLRYEDLVADPAAALARIAPVLGVELRAPAAWDATRIHPSLLKLDRHTLLESGRVSRERVGLWRTCGRRFSDESHATARLMGYD